MCKHLHFLWFAALLGPCPASLCRAGENPVANSVQVSPATIELRHHRQPHQVQVMGASADGYTLDLRPQTKFVSADPKIATVDEHGWVRPAGNGQTQLSVTVA